MKRSSVRCQKKTCLESEQISFGGGLPKMATLGCFFDFDGSYDLQNLESSQNRHHHRMPHQILRWNTFSRLCLQPIMASLIQIYNCIINDNLRLPFASLLRYYSGAGFWLDLAFFFGFGRSPDARQNTTSQSRELVRQKERIWPDSAQEQYVRK